MAIDPSLTTRPHDFRFGEAVFNVRYESDEKCSKAFKVNKQETGFQVFRILGQGTLR